MPVSLKIFPISTHALREEGDSGPADRCPAAPISTHALREEGDIMANYVYATDPRFLPTPSARRATTLTGRICRPGRISTHALREEGDPQQMQQVANMPISTHALREEGDQAPVYAAPEPEISTHALREEGDAVKHGQWIYDENFYPRPPRGGRPRVPRFRATLAEFLPTPSARRATRV